MVMLSWFWMIFLAICCLFFGYALSHFLQSGGSKNLKSEHAQLTKEHVSLAKSQKSTQKSFDKLQKKHTELDKEYKQLQSEVKMNEEKHRENLSELDTRIAALEKENKSLKADLNSSNVALDRTKKQYSQLTEKYTTELKELKDWKKGKDAFDRELNLYKNKSETANQKADRLQTETSTLKQEIIDLKTKSESVRQLKVKIRVLDKDLKYWEQKHYDTHHELAEERKKTEQRVLDFQGLESEKAELQAIIKKMEGQVKEYKEQYVAVNDKYHKLAFNK